MENLAVFLAGLALAVAGLCVWQIHNLQGRMEWLSGALRAQSDQNNVQDRLAKLEAASPGLGEIMSGLQIHAAKLYYAGKAHNWPLADFEMSKMEEALTAVPLVRPQENGVPLGAVIRAFENSQWAALKEAVSRQDMAAFNTGYSNMVFVCNACHQATGRPFIMIQTPNNPPVPNQIWKVVPPPVPPTTSEPPGSR